MIAVGRDTYGHRCWKGTSAGQGRPGHNNQDLFRGAPVGPKTDVDTSLDWLAHSTAFDVLSIPQRLD